MTKAAIDAAKEVQARAAVPGRSVILRAAAGSGKTRVLVDRFVRLCVTGAPARSILAVTFTRKAATEIKQRIFKRARSFARAAPAELRSKLSHLLGKPPTDTQVDRAAWLYEQLLEDPGSLHVGTIHSFCQGVLERFAAEVGIDPHFGVLDDEQELWEEATEHLAAEIAVDPALRADAAQLAVRPDALHGELRRLRDDRVHLQRWIARIKKADPASAPGGSPVGGPVGGPVDDAVDDAVGEPFDLLALLPHLLADLRAGLFVESVLAGVEEPSPLALLPAAAEALRLFATDGLTGIEAAEIAGQTPKFPAEVEHYRAAAMALADACQTVSADATAAAATAATAAATAADAATAIATTITATATAERNARRLLDNGADLFLTKNHEKLRAFKGKRATGGARQAAFAAAAAPFLRLWSLADLVDLYRWNRALLRLGLRALDIYATLKRRDRLVDFHDLEQLTWQTMRDPELGPWIQYRLDTVIDHLLIDEFQDTNRNQWEILEPMVDEILAGEGDRPRSVFLVGDIKQSIYSFRGAAPDVFREVQRDLDGHPGVDQMTLPTNFRSQPQVVTTLGRLFGVQPLAEIIDPVEAADAKQLPARLNGPVEVVFVEPLPTDDSGLTGDERAATATAALVGRLVDQEQIDVALPGDPPQERAITCGDILILCRSRTQITLYEQALRRAHIPIVPAGRGLLARSREVQDILALLRWLAYPDDDVALTAVLRSPLMRASEEVVQRALGARLGTGTGGKKTSLWNVVWRLGEEFGLTEEARLLHGWRGAVGRQDAHGLLRRIYREGYAPERFAVALGEQARFNLLRLLDLTLSADLGPAPTLRRLTDVIERAARTGGEEEGVAPESDGGGRVRLMTVHAAKGLEAPVVILVDAAAPLRGNVRSQKLAGGYEPMVFGLRKRHLEGPDLAGTPLDVPLTAIAAERRAADLAEEAHILYVALTRARDRLYVLGGEPSRLRQGPSFLDWLLAAATAATAASAATAGGAERPFQIATAEWADRLTAAARATAAGSIDTALAAGGLAAQPAGSESAILWLPPPLGRRIELVHPSAIDLPGELPPAMSVDPDPGDAVTADGEMAATDGEMAATDGEMAAADGETARAAAITRGGRIHLLLQCAAEQGAMPPRPPADTATTVVEAWEEAAAVFANPAFGWIFRPATTDQPDRSEADEHGFCELPVIARLPAAGSTGPTAKAATGAGPERRLVGVIDRLLVRPGRVDIVDYKSNRAANDPGQLDALVQHYRGQLDAYREVVQTLYPELEVRCWLLFTNPVTEQGRGVLREVS